MTDLEVSVAQVEPAELGTPLLVIQQFERDVGPLPAALAVDRVLEGRIAYAIESGDFRGRRDETLLFYPDVGSSGPERVLLVGVGKREDFTLESVRRAVGLAVREAQRLGVGELALALGHTEALSEHMGPYFAARGAVESAVLAAWSFREFKTSPDEERRDLLRRLVLTARDETEASAMRRAADYARVAAGAENYARELATRPGNDATPSFLADAAQGLGQTQGFEVSVLDREALEREGMKALLAVARGSDEPPRFIVMEYRGGEANAPPLVLVGKGVTFDSGGISIKPADRMEEMKYDMSGAAAVIAALGGIARLKLRANVVGLCPATENLPSGRALKPGDVIGSHLGKTIEVVNTDAEGRLI
ncbi:MAG: leucyl aminopeptidase family protein, partial [Longimicrobiales bacterium]